MWRKLFASSPKEEFIDLYMKSGHKITIDRVLDWGIKATGNEITYLKLTQHKNALEKLIVNSINLAQIESIVRRAW